LGPDAAAGIDVEPGAHCIRQPDHLLPCRRAARARTALADRQGKAAAMAVSPLTHGAVWRMLFDSNSVNGVFLRRSTMKFSKAVLLGLALFGATTVASAQNEQFIPMNGYWVGPYAAGGSGIFGGFIDYINMLNARDGGVNGVKITYEKCETEYNNARGVECYEREKKKGPTGATVIHPLSTGITYSLIDKVAADHIPMISLGYGRTDASDGRV